MRFLFWIYRRTAALGRWFGRRFTPAGGFVLAGWALVSTLVSGPEQSVAYQAWALLGAMIAMGVLFAPRFRARLTVERRLPRFGTLGQPLHYRLTIRNLAARRQTGLEYLECFRGGELSYETFVDRLRPGRRMRSLRLSEPLPPVDPASARPRALPPVPAHGTAELTAEVLPLRRGPLHFAGAWLARRDPLGLFRGLCWAASPGSTMILPRRYPVPAQALPGQTKYQHGGVALASGVGESEEFVGVREYRHGDSLRRIHWRATARIGRPVVREHQEEFFVRHGLVLDTFCDVSMDNVFEEAVSVAASFACTVPDQESLLDLLFVGPRTVCVTVGRGVGHTEHLLETLACARACREPRFVELQELVIRHSARMSGCLLVLLDWNAERRGLVARLKALRIPVRVLLVVPPGEAHVLAGSGAGEGPDRVTVLESGKIAEGLRTL
jgi:uncharacterized protein (DUF58 family)